MTLEAGKEMDRRCAMNWLYEVYITPSRAFSEYTDDELKMFAHDALVLLKEQEAVEPVKHIDKIDEHGRFIVWWGCPVCNFLLNGKETKFCGGCGRSVKWE